MNTEAQGFLLEGWLRLSKKLDRVNDWRKHHEVVLRVVKARRRLGIITDATIAEADKRVRASYGKPTSNNICKENMLNFYLDPSIDLEFLKEVDSNVEWKLFEADLFDILVSLQVFSSRSQARKNWNQGELRGGFNFFERVGKKRWDLCIYT